MEEERLVFGIAMLLVGVEEKASCKMVSSRALAV